MSSVAAAELATVPALRRERWKELNLIAEWEVSLVSCSAAIVGRTETNSESTSSRRSDCPKPGTFQEKKERHLFI